MNALQICNTIVASALEQTTWLRKNFQIRLAQPDLENPLTTPDSSAETDRIPEDETTAIDFDSSYIR